MAAYDDGRGGRRARERDMASSRPANYYDDAYERAPPRSSRHASYPDEPARRPRRNTHGGGGVNVVASDDGSGSPPYGPSDAYPGGRRSRHDVEHRTGDKDRRFRERRGAYEANEAANLRRAKSHSPRRAAAAMAAASGEAGAAPRRVSPQDRSRPAWSGDEHAGGAAHHHRTPRRGGPAQYYEHDPYAGYYAGQAPPPPRERTSERGRGYAPSATEMPRPPMGEHAPAAPQGRPGADDKKQPGRHHQRRRERDYYGSPGREDHAAPEAAAAAAGTTVYDQAPPRRHRRSRHHDDGDDGDNRAGADGYPPPPATRGRGGDYGATDPYGGAREQPPRPRHRQSMPPQPRSRHAEDDDPYGQPGGAGPPRRATSVSYGGRDRYGGGARRDQQYYYDDDDDNGGAYGGRGAARRGGGNKKSKAYAQQAGKLFMTHAVPVIKKEAVPFLTKAAQAYLEQQRR